MLKHAENLLKDVLLFETPPAQLLVRYFRDNKQLGARDRAVLSDVIYTVFREKSYFEYVIQNHKSCLSFERCLSILGGREHLDWLQRYLSADEQEWLACIEEGEGVAGALPHHIRYSLPEWLVAALKEQLGEDEFEAAALTFLEKAPLDLRANIMKGKPLQIQKKLAELGVDTQVTPFSPWGLRTDKKVSLSENPLYLDGSIEVQDEGSQLLALLVGAKRNEVIVDYCAGAGGKALAMGSMMRDTGRIYAWDVVAYRLSGLKPRLKRSGLNNVFTAVLSNGEEERVRRLYGKADRVLVDAPCSGLGTLRRAPELKWYQSPESVLELSQVQTLILSDACKLVKEGGLLVYATCSVLPEENEQVARLFSARHTEFEMVNMKDLLAARKIDASQSLVKEGYLRLWPHRHQTDGFFAAAWRKK